MRFVTNSAAVCTLTVKVDRTLIKAEGDANHISYDKVSLKSNIVRFVWRTSFSIWMRCYLHCEAGKRP